jgi:DNA mismatch repair ATPase MutL
MDERVHPKRVTLAPLPERVSSEAAASSPAAPLTADAAPAASSSTAIMPPTPLQQQALQQQERTQQEQQAPEPRQQGRQQDQQDQQQQQHQHQHQHQQQQTALPKPPRQWQRSTLLQQQVDARQERPEAGTASNGAPAPDGRVKTGAWDAHSIHGEAVRARSLGWGGKRGGGELTGEAGRGGAGGRGEGLRAGSHFLSRRPLRDRLPPRGTGASQRSRALPDRAAPRSRRRRCQAARRRAIAELIFFAGVNDLR